MLVKDIPGYEGRYAATEDGKIWSYPKKKLHNGMFLRGRKAGRYWNVMLINVNGKQWYSSVHRLIALAYLPNPKGLPQVNHIDGNPKNNAVSNLEWCTARQNTQHSWDIGLSKHRGNGHYKTSITEKDVREIKLLAERNMTNVAIAKQFGIGKWTVSDILRGVTWKHLK